MTNRDYDVIVIGARCAGSPTAMLLAGAGCRVLLVDRATFPSDTLSTHLLHPPGVNSLRRWGLLAELTATDCPPIDTYRFDFEAFTLSGAPGTIDSPVAYAPRRTVLDQILLSAAARAGVEVRQGFNVSAIEIDTGRVVGVRGGRDGQPSANVQRWWSGRTGCARHSRPRSVRKPTGNGPGCWPATTATGRGWP
jgi:flavin-dependent dehydrogenase